MKEIGLLNESKASQEKVISVKIIKVNKDLFSEIFPDSLKKAEIKLIFKKRIKKLQRKLSVCKHLIYLFLIC